MAAHAFSTGTMPLPVQVAGNHVPSARGASEQKLGILYMVSPVDTGFHGEVRKRYTDFIVNEVRKDATVVHLTEYEEQAPTVPQPKKDLEKVHARPANTATKDEDFIPPADITTLNELLGQTTTGDILKAYYAICKGDNIRGINVALAVVQDRVLRTRIHQEIRRIFFGKFETQVDPASGLIRATAASRGSTRRNTQSDNGGISGNRRSGGTGPKPGEEYLHFTLYKENRDTMDAINNIARMLKIKSNLFGFAGTKDRRACTTQRMSVRYGRKADFIWLNGKIPNVKLGDLSYHKKPIQLGQHGGNEFVITLKNVHLVRGEDYSLKHRLRCVEACVQKALDSIIKDGFINYFGLQRFGTHAIGTQEIGMKILQGNFEGAIDMILAVDPQIVSGKFTPDQLTEVFHRDEIARSRGIHIFKTTGNLDKALEMVPKRFTAEQTILRHLGRSMSSRRDFCGALLTITRGLRNLYIHSYQSLVWNWVASQRWARHGNQVIKGDLVLEAMEGDPRFTREPNDMSEDVNQEEEEFYQQARALTAKEAASGKYSITDIVLPIPGYDMIYPENDIGDFYAEFMGRPENGGLDPYQMRRPQREFSLSGHYRKLIASFTSIPMFAVRPYADDTEQMHPTDSDQLNRNRSKAKETSSAPQPKDAVSTQDSKRTTTDRGSSEPAEPRVNDIWVETASDGGSGSKRMKKATGEETDPAGDQSSNAGASFASPSLGFPIDPSPKDDVFGPSKTTLIPLLEGGTVRYVPIDEIRRLNAAFDSATTMASSLQPGGSLSANAPPFKPGTQMNVDVPAAAATAAAAPAARAGAQPTLGELAAEMDDLFKDQPIIDKDGKVVERAVNCTGKWRDCVLPENLNLKVAIILNIRLNSSNYATVCLRELMSTAEVDAALNVSRR